MAPAKQSFLASLAAASATETAMERAVRIAKETAMERAARIAKETEARDALALGQLGANLLDVSLDNQEDNEFGALYLDLQQADNNPSVMAVTDGNLDLETATTLSTERLQSTETVQDRD